MARIGNYETLRTLSAHRYEVRHVPSGHTLWLDWADGDGDEAAKLRELSTASTLEHANVITPMDSGIADIDGKRRPYVVYAPLTTLALPAFRDAHPYLPGEERTLLVDQLLAALEAAHHLGLVHRGLSLEQIFVAPATDDGPRFVLRVAGFGLAPKNYEAPPLDVAQCLSPEQWRRSHADERSDLYAAGAIAYFIETGELPYRGDLAALQNGHLFGRIERLRSPLAHFIRRSLSKRAEERHASARDARRSLGATYATEATRTEPGEAAPLPAKLRTRVAFVVGVVSVVVGGAVLYVLLR